MRTRYGQVRVEYVRLLRRLKDGKLFGKVLDMNNIEELVVAAYYYGLGFAFSYPLEQQLDDGKWVTKFEIKKEDE